VNIFLNLLLNKELSQKREAGRYQCKSCNREYNNVDLVYKDNNIFWEGNYPQSGVCNEVIYMI
jgi:hypothetical protein